ncbi:MAG: hypothetical protein F6K26_30920 [Moorea sp. SIO2I5]|nr:hypothetical protein [Moorena sp. SIO2I5]
MGLTFGQSHPALCTLPRWCVTGRTISTRALRPQITASPPLTHPTPLPTPDSRFPIPDSRFPNSLQLLQKSRIDT